MYILLACSDDKLARAKHSTPKGKEKSQQKNTGKQGFQMKKLKKNCIFFRKYSTPKGKEKRQQNNTGKQGFQMKKLKKNHI